MSDYIKREDAIKAVAEYTKDCFGTFEDAILNAEDVVLDSVPSADVIEPKRGEWIVDEEQGTSTCSACGIVWQFTDGTNGSDFCPNCGAKMKGADDE